MRRWTMVLAAAALALVPAMTGPGAASATPGQELVTNGGFETPDATGPGPALWAGQSWGAAVGSTFSWVSGGAHSETYSARIDQVADTVNTGDSKWVPALIEASAGALHGGTYYVFSDWYKSDVNTVVKVYYETDTNGDGVVEGHWAGLFAGIAPAATWTRYESGFTMPLGTLRAFFVHLIDRKGCLQTDDVSVQEAAAPAGFGRPIVSLTFDDGSANNYVTAVPRLDAKGFKTTQYIPTYGLTSSPRDDFLMTDEEIKAVSNAGHEIGSHSVNHPDLTDPTIVPGLDFELAESKAVLERITGKPVLDFAYPFGTYDATVIAAEQTAGYASGRSVEEGYNARPDLEPFDIRGQNMTPEVTIDQFKSWVDYAKAHDYWLVVIYHEIKPDIMPRCPAGTEDDTDCLGDYDTTVSKFTEQLEYLKTTVGSDVMTVQHALDVIAASGSTGGGGTGGGTNPGTTTVVPPVSTPAPVHVAPAPVVALKATLRAPRQRLATVLRRGLQVATTSTKPGVRRVEVVLGSAAARRLGLGRKAVVIGTARTTLVSAGPRTMLVRLSARAKRRLARARSVDLTVRLAVTAPDGGGVARATSHVTVRR